MWGEGWVGFQVYTRYTTTERMKQCKDAMMSACVVEWLISCHTTCHNMGASGFVSNKAL